MPLAMSGVKEQSNLRSLLVVRVRHAPPWVVNQKSLAELVDAKDRRSGLRDGGVGRVARRQMHRASP
jgi:hypothetical protein